MLAVGCQHQTLWGPLMLFAKQLLAWGAALITLCLIQYAQRSSKGNAHRGPASTLQAGLEADGHATLLEWGLNRPQMWCFRARPPNCGVLATVVVVLRQAFEDAERLGGSYDNEDWCEAEDGLQGFPSYQPGKNCYSLQDLATACRTNVSRYYRLSCAQYAWVGTGIATSRQAIGAAGASCTL